MAQMLKIKVCGIKFPENRKALEQLPVDILGFIFYPPSPRYAGPDNAVKGNELFSAQKLKAGVFVDSPAETITELINSAGLGLVQLHGNETPEFCETLKKTGIQLIKAFRVDQDFDFSQTEEFLDVSDYFLFDTKAHLPGGTGKKFDWEILENYDGRIPFFLSGGIGPNDVEQVKNLRHEKLFGIDLNSGFEDSPGLKNITLLEKFIKQLNRE